ncbi:MAG: hypothetical protein JNM63_14490 [Spirochaetia bacterium]|nr:hypothetical protein [Spirochaetia bacterium]
MKIGELLISKGKITQAQLDEALKIQKEKPHKLLGEVLVELQFIHADVLADILSEKDK